MFGVQPCQKTSRLIASMQPRMYFAHNGGLGTALWPWWCLGALCLSDLCSRLAAILLHLDGDARCCFAPSLRRTNLDFLFCHHPQINAIDVLVQHGLKPFG